MQTFEVTGWRNKRVTLKICKILENNEPLQFYSLLCPSYIKGMNKAGFRTDDVGNTTKNGLEKLMEITKQTEKIGFICKNPEAIFFDIALEQPDKTIYMLEDLKQNIQNVKKYIPNGMKFSILSEKYPELKEIVGYYGVQINPLPVDNDILERIIERGKKFYNLFGWNIDKVIERSKIIASSESTVGTFIRHDMPKAIM